LRRADITVHTDGSTLSVHGTTTDRVSQIAFDHRLRIVEINEASRSLEEILLDITGETAAFASA
jgi:ABC-2 type transport system ATP-binding protein